MSCEECLKKDKKIRVMTSDHEFQLRKISEDKAEEKALFEISLQKELRKWQEKYQKQKLDHEENSKKWLSKIDSNSAACQQKISDAKRLYDSSIQSYKEQNQAKLQEEREATTKKYLKEIQDLKDSHQKQRNTLENSYKAQLNEMQAKYENEIEKLKRQAKDRQNKLINEFDSTIVGLRSEKNAQQKQNLKLQEEHRRQRSKYLSEIYDHKSMITALEGNVSQLKQNLATKEKELEEKKAEMAKLCERHQMELQQAEKQKERLQKEWQLELENQLKNFYEKQLQITELYENSIQSIDEKRETQKSLYSNNLHQIRTCMETRPSRVEDLEEILLLRQKLGRKEKEYETLAREVKHIQLELDNKEDTYNRIFIPSFNSAHLNQNIAARRNKDLKLKRAGKSVSTVRDILHAVNVNCSNLPSLNSIDKKYLPPKSNKIL